MSLDRSTSRSVRIASYLLFVLMSSLRPRGLFQLARHPGTSEVEGSGQHQIQKSHRDIVGRTLTWFPIYEARRTIGNRANESFYKHRVSMGCLAQRGSLRLRSRLYEHRALLFTLVMAINRPQYLQCRPPTDAVGSTEAISEDI